MDRFDLLTVISEIFEECKTDEEINTKKEQIIRDVEAQANMSKLYLQNDIL